VFGDSHLANDERSCGDLGTHLVEFVGAVLFFVAAARCGCLLSN
jgi:hypothetical protein